MLKEELELEDAVEDETEDTGEVDELEAEVEEVEEEAADAGDDSENDGEEEGEEDEGSAPLTITIEGEEEVEDEGNGIRNLRQAHKEQKQRIKELEAKLKAAQPQDVELGEKPTLEQFDYDAERYEAALLDWTDRKRDHEKKAEQEQRKQQEAAEAYQAKLTVYTQRKASLGAKDFDQAEQSVLSDLSQEQQSVIVAHSEAPELLVYALGKNDKVRERLAASDNLIEFAYELAKLEKGMKVTGTTKPAPEKRIKGTKGVSVSADKKLEMLEAEADRTGDRTKVLAYKRQMAQRK